MATKTKKKGFEFRIGASPAEHEVCYNGEHFPWLASMDVEVGSGDRNLVANARLLLNHDIRVRGKFEVTERKGSTLVEDSLFRDGAEIDLHLSGGSVFRRLCVDGELVPFKSASLRLGEQTDFVPELTFTMYHDVTKGPETYTIKGVIYEAIKEVRDENIPGEEIH